MCVCVEVCVRGKGEEEEDVGEKGKLRFWVCFNRRSLLTYYLIFSSSRRFPGIFSGAQGTDLDEKFLYSYTIIVLPEAVLMRRRFETDSLLLQSSHPSFHLSQSIVHLSQSIDSYLPGSPHIQIDS